MDNRGTDQTERLRGLPPSQRAREAAANGFAAGTGGDKRQAGKYFDLAFSAADEVWDARTPEMNAAAVVQEISEAAAQVDSLNALTRAQKLRDSSAQAIAMLAVARVVASNGITR
jgi:Cdc6-like AAA superfamily ATPase